MTPVFERVAVLGLGLLGGSVALAARARGAASRVVGATRRAEVAQEALRREVVDAAADYVEAVRDAELVVLATPVHAMGELLRRVAPALCAGAIVTDVGSVKAALAETLPGLLPRGVAYVGSHPMAGSHERGFEHARSDLFEGATCVVMQGADARARDRVAAFWSALGARVVLRDPAQHDAEVAWMSHVPHALAFAFARALAQAPPAALEVQGPGFRDFTRIAHSDAELWADILTANRKALAGPLQASVRALEALCRALDEDDGEGVERIIAAGHAALNPGEVRGADRAESPEPPTVERPGGTQEGNQHE